MPTYIQLTHWTEKGLQTVKEAPARLDAAKQAAKALGGEIKAAYMVMGRYDLVVIFEAPDDEAVARGTLALGMQGNLRTETLKAFTEDEFRKIIATLP